MTGKPVPDTNLRPRLLPSLLALVVGMMATGIGSFVSKQISDSRWQSEFSQDCQTYTSALQMVIAQHVQYLESVGGLYAASQKVTRQEFSQFVSQRVAQHPEIGALAWCSLAVSEFGEHERPRRLQAPITFIEPREGNESWLGRDLASRADNEAAFALARDSGRMLAIDLADTTHVAPDQPNLLLLLPIYHNESPIATMEDRRSSLSGYVVTMFRVVDLVERALGTLPARGIDILISTQNPQTTPQIVYLHASRTRPGDSHPAVANLDAYQLHNSLQWPGKQWQLTYAPAPSYLVVERSDLPAGVLISGILLTLILTLYLFSLARNEARMAVAANALQSSEARLRQITAAAQDAVIMIDDKGVTSFWNPAAERLFGYPEDVAIGQTLHALIAPARYKEAYSQGMAQFRISGEGPAIGPINELVARRQDGKEFPVELSVASFRQNNAWHAVGIVRDITRRKKAESSQLQLEAQLREQQKLAAVGTLARGMAHEINNPIFGIMNYAQLIRDELEPASTLHEYASEIILESERVATLVRRLLGISDQRAQEIMSITIARLIEDAMTAVSARLKTSSIAVEREPGAPLPPISCRPRQLQEVLVTLIINAADALDERFPASDPDKRIRLSARIAEREGESVIRLVVEDRGPGITAEIRERLFEPFFTTKSRSSFVGLGLATARDLMMQNGGNLWLEESRCGLTRFCIEIPMTI